MLPNKDSKDVNGIGKLRSRIIYTVLGIVIFVLLISAMANSVGHVKVKNTFVTNQTSSSASVVWATDKTAIGRVEVSTTADFANVLQYYDDRDLEETGIGVYKLNGQQKRAVHHVTIRGLNPETTYYYRIINNDKTEEVVSFVTPKVNEDIVAPDPIYGRVAGQNDGVVLLQKKAGEGNSQVVSAVINEGSYSIDGGNLLNEKLENTYVKQNYIEELNVLGSGQITKVQIENDKDQPVAEIVPGKDVLIESANVEIQAEQKFYSPNPAHQDNCCNIESRGCSNSDQWTQGWNECAIEGKCGCVAKTQNSNTTVNNNQTSSNTVNPKPAPGVSASEYGDCIAAKGNPNSCKQDGLCNPLDVYAQTGGNLVDGQNCPDNQGYIERFRQEGGGCGYRFRGCVKGTSSASNNNNQTSNNTTSSGKACYNGTIPHGSYSCLTTTSYIRCIDGVYSTTEKGTCSSCRGTSSNLGDICQNASGQTVDNTNSNTNTDNSNNNNNNNNTAELKCGDIDSTAACVAQFGNGGCNIPKDGTCSIKNGVSNCVYGYNCRSAKCVADGKICTGDGATSSDDNQPVAINEDAVPAGYKNVATSAQIGAANGSIDSAKYPPTNAIDNNGSSFWYNRTNASDGPASITLKWDAVQKISKVRIKSAWDKKFNSKLTFLVSDGLTEPTKDVDNNDSTLWDSIDFDIETNKLIIEYKKASDPGNSAWGGWGYMYEIQVLVADASTQPVTAAGKCTPISVCEDSEHQTVDLMETVTKIYNCAGGSTYTYTCEKAGNAPKLLNEYHPQQGQVTGGNITQENQNDLTVSGGNQSIVSEVHFVSQNIQLLQCSNVTSSVNSTLDVSIAQAYPSGIIRYVSEDGSMYLVKVNNTTGWIKADSFKEQTQLPTLNRTKSKDCYDKDGVVIVNTGLSQLPENTSQNSQIVNVDITNEEAKAAKILAYKKIQSGNVDSLITTGILEDSKFQLTINGQVTAWEGLELESPTSATYTNKYENLSEGDYILNCALKLVTDKGVNELLIITKAGKSYLARNIFIKSVYDTSQKNFVCDPVINNELIAVQIKNNSDVWEKFYAYDKNVPDTNQNSIDGNVQTVSEIKFLDDAFTSSNFGPGVYDARYDGWSVNDTLTSLPVGKYEIINAYDMNGINFLHLILNKGATLGNGYEFVGIDELDLVLSEIKDFKPGTYDIKGPKKVYIQLGYYGKQFNSLNPGTYSFGSNPKVEYIDIRGNLSNMNPGKYYFPGVTRLLIHNLQNIQPGTYEFINLEELGFSMYLPTSNVNSQVEFKGMKKLGMENYCGKNLPVSIDSNIENTSCEQTSASVDTEIIIASEPNLLDPGSYKVEGTNVTTKEFTISEPGKVVYFQDINGDGIKQESEPLYTGDVNSLNIQFNKVSEVQSYNMNYGWNLVSFPIYMRGDGTSNIAKASDLITQLNSGGINTTHVVAYRSGKFVTYSNRKDDSGNQVAFGEDFSILPGEGYFVRSYTTGIFIVKGKKIENGQQILMENGWNMVGIYNSGKLSYKGFEVLKQMNTAGVEADILSKWENGLYQNVVVEGGKEYGIDYGVYPYQGYFVRVKNRGSGVYTPQ